MGSVDRKDKVSLVIGCVDNFEARQVLETVSEDLQVPFMDAVVSDDAMSGSVQLIIPGRTGGLEAAPIKSHMDKRSGTCPASLPTTDSIIAGLHLRMRAATVRTSEVMTLSTSGERGSRVYSDPVNLSL